jgi:hypothetical protein
MKKKTKNGKKIPISNYDRVQALLRIPEYLKDLKDIKKGFNRDKLKKFRSKYHLSGPIIDFEFVKKYTPQRLERISIFTDEQITIVKPHQRGKFIKKMVTFREEDGQKEVLIYDRSPFLRGKRYLTIEIDLKKSKTKLLGKIKYYIDDYGKYVDRQETRYKESGYSPWEVYKLYKDEKLTFSEIARQLSGREGNPSYNEKLMAEFKKVKRAFEKACDIINQVRKDIELTKTNKHLSE